MLVPSFFHHPANSSIGQLRKVGSERRIIRIDAAAAVAAAAAVTQYERARSLTDLWRVLLLESVCVLRRRERPPCGADGLPWGGLLRRKSSDLPVRRALG